MISRSLYRQRCRVIRPLASIALLLAGAPAIAQNLVPNPGFESPQFSLNPNYRYLNGANATLLPGWTWQYDGIGEPSYVYDISRYPTFEGTKSVSLNDGDAASTSFPTERGCGYVLSFVTLGDDGGLLRVQAGTGGLDVSINPPAIGVETGVFYDPTNEWKRVYLPFTALSEVSPLSFSDAPQGRPYSGRILDDVAVVQGPVIMVQPADALTCPGSSVTLSIEAVGVAVEHRWQIQDPASPGGWRDLDDGPLEINGVEWGTVSGARTKNCLFLHGVGTKGDGSLNTRCVVSDPCTSATSHPAAVRICPANINCDSTVDLADFLAFFNCYDAEDACADIDGQPGTDLGDFLTFFNAYDSGC